MTWKVFRNERTRISLTSSARMMGAGKPNTTLQTLIMKVLRITTPALRELKNISK